MLNEYKEFESYVSNPTSKNPRIQPKLFTGLFDDECYLIGIEQIMTVIARNYIFSNKDEKTKDFVDEQTRNEAIEILHRWTGFSDIEERSRTENVILDKNVAVSANRSLVGKEGSPFVLKKDSVI